MTEKSYKSSLFKRIIDLGVVREADVDDLVRIWRVGTGDEKAITLANFVATVDADLGSGGSTLTELIEELELNKVPYTGATGNVDLGEFGLSGGFFKFDTTPTSTPTDQGTMFWDEDDLTVDIILNGYRMKIGEDQFYPVKNQTGTLIPKGTSVRFAGTVGASGRLLIAPFLADGTFPSTRFMGVTAEDIDNGEDGKVLWFGRLRGIDTSGFVEGDILYASTTVAGAFQTTIPVSPNNIVEIAAVVTDATNGTIFIRPQFISKEEVGAGLSRDIDGKIQLGFEDYAGNRTIRITDWEDSSLAEIVNLTDDFIIYQNLSKFSESQTQFYTDLSNNVGDGSARFSIFTNANTSFIQLSRGSDTGFQALRFFQASDGHLIKLTDTINSKGIEYDGDYESNFTARSLVTKQYVDGAVSGATISIGSPANGLSLAGTVLSLGLASSGVTGALSGTDWNTFNGKLNLTSPLTGFTVGANTALADTDTLLGAFGKIQGQINARVGFTTLSAGQVAFTVDSTTIRTDSSFSWDNSINLLNLGGAEQSRLSLGLALARGSVQISNPYLNTGTFNRRVTIGNNSYVDNTNSIIRANTALGGSFISFSALQLTNDAMDFYVYESGGATNIQLSLTPNIAYFRGSLGVNGVTSPTNTLDVNGTTRIRTISNLGSTATRFLVASATGVISERTGAELAADIGATNFWTLTGSDIYRNSKVAIGRTTIPTGATFSVQSDSATGTTQFFQLLNNAGSSLVNLQQNGVFNISFGIFVGGISNAGIANGIKAAFTNSTPALRIVNNSDLVIADFRSNRQFITNQIFVGGVSEANRFNAIKVAGTADSQTAFAIDNNSDVNIIDFRANGDTYFNGLFIFNDGKNIFFNTTTGTKIGTATNQKIGFWNATPIVQPTTGVAAATLVSNAGTTLTSTDTFDGYTLQQIVRALRNTGLLA